MGLALTLYDIGQYEECKKDLEELLVITRKTLGEKGNVVNYL